MKEHKSLLQNLKDEFASFSNTFNDYFNTISPKIVRIAWATEPQFYLELLYIERSRVPKGRFLKEEPEVKKSCIKLGYDTQDNLIYEELFGNHPSHGYFKFYIYLPSSIYSYRFNREKKLEEIEIQKLEKGVPIWYSNFAKNKANVVDKYIYQNNQLQNIETLWIYDKHEQFPRYEIEYHKINKIKSITRIDEKSNHFPNGQNIIIYKKHNFSINELSLIIENEAVFEIEKQLENIKATSLISSLFIYSFYAFNSDNWFPPYIIWSTEDERNKIGKGNYDVWNPHKLQNKHIQLSNEILNEASTLFIQECEMKEDYTTCQKVVTNIAKKLKNRNTFTNSKYSDDFAILSLSLPDDYSYLDNYNGLYNIMKTTCETKEIKILEKNGWLKK